MTTIIKRYLTNNPCYKAGKKITVKGLMLHSVGTAQPSAMVFVNNWDKSSYTRACVHGFIDANSGDIYQTLPWNHRGWHAGGSGNNTHIGVEMCESSYIKYTSGANFTMTDREKALADIKRTYDSAVFLFAFLCKEYNLNPLTQICSHREGHSKGIASNHGDPEHLWRNSGIGYTMDGFRADVKKAMGGTVVTPTQPAPQRLVGNPLVLKGQQESVKFTGVQIACDGIYGPESKKQCIRVLQRAMNLDYNSGLAVDGIWGPKSNQAIKGHYIQKGEVQYMVTAVEIICYMLGLNPNGVEYKGIYGNGLAKALGKDKVDYNQIKALLNLQ